MKAVYWVSFFVVIALGHYVRADDIAHPYDQILAAYSSYLTTDDPLSLPLKLRAISNDPYTYWRGTKPLFYRWAKENCTDWLNDKSSYILCHGDLHLGNMGSYAAESGWGKLAFGLVDFDEASVMPYQIELLQGYISLRLAALRSSLSISSADQQRLVNTLLENYAAALKDSRTATDALAHEGALQPLFWDARKEYSKVLKQLVVNDKFKTMIMDKDGNLKDILRPAMNHRDEFAHGIAQAIARSPLAQTRFRLRSEDELRAAIKDIVQRTRIDSSGSQGLQKYYVLLDKPLAGMNHDMVLYLKREVPSAAEHVGMIPAADQSSGQRVAIAADVLTSPHFWLNLWCDIGQGESRQSFWITMREPWSEDLSPNVVDTDSLFNLARVWATAAGAAHRNSFGMARAATIAPQNFHVSLNSAIMIRGEEYLTLLQAQYADFVRDSRVVAAKEKVETHLSAFQHVNVLPKP